MMFRHLDDPDPFRPDDQFHRSVVARGHRLRRRRRLATTVGSLALVVGTVGGAGAFYVERRNEAIDRIDVATSPSTDGATNILLVGSDARPPGSEPEVEGSRADSIVVVRLATDGSVDVLSISAYLTDPSTGDRLNAHDEPQELVDTISRVLGLPIDHYVQLDFAGFVETVDQLGGLQVAIEVPLHDQFVGLDLRPTACTTLDGETTLALLRARHLEGDTSGDFGRMARGQALLTAAVAQLANEGDDPVTIDRFTRTLADHAMLDSGLDLDRMVDIGQHVAAAGPSGVQTTTLPVVEVSRPDETPSVQLALDAAPVLEQFGRSAGHEIPDPPQPAAAVQVPTEPLGGIRPC